MKTIWAFIKALPDILELVRQIIQSYEDHKRAQELKKDLQEINAAFRERDGKRLARVFSRTAKKRVPAKDD
jgi:prephenate dehydrogenase